MGFMDDDDSSTDDHSDDGGIAKMAKGAPPADGTAPNPQDNNEAQIKKSDEPSLTPMARMKLQQEAKEKQLYEDFCEFASNWLETREGGCVQKHMVVLYFREHYSNHKYKFSETAEDLEIEEAFLKWNAAENGPHAEQNEFGLFVGVQINAEFEKEKKQADYMEERKRQTKAIIADCKRRGEKPPLEVLREALEFGVIDVPQDTLDSIKQAEDRAARRRSVQFDKKALPHIDRSKRPARSEKDARQSIKRLGKSLGDLNFSLGGDSKPSSSKEKSSSRDKDSHKKSSSKDKDKKEKKKSSSSRMHKSMGNLDLKSSSEKKSSSRDKEKKSSSRDKDSDKKKSSSKSSSSRMHKSMNLDYKPKSSSRDKDDKKHDKKSDTKESKKDDKKDKKKSSSSKMHKSMGDLDYKKSSSEKKSSSRDKDKEKKSSSRDKDKPDKEKSDKKKDDKKKSDKKDDKKEEKKKDEKKKDEKKEKKKDDKKKDDKKESKKDSKKEKK